MKVLQGRRTGNRGSLQPRTLVQWRQSSCITRAHRRPLAFQEPREGAGSGDASAEDQLPLTWAGIGFLLISPTSRSLHSNWGAGSNGEGGGPSRLPA